MPLNKETKPNQTKPKDAIGSHYTIKKIQLEWIRKVIYN